jgi:hypothetical protein
MKSLGLLLLMLALLAFCLGTWWTAGLTLQAIWQW